MININVGLHWQKKYVEDFFSKKSITSNIHLHNNASFENLLATLLQGECEGFVYHLSEIPLSLPENVAITAVSERFSPQYELLIPTTDYSESNFLRISNEAIIQVDDDFLKPILSDISLGFRYETAANIAKIQPAFYNEQGITNAIYPHSFLLSSREFPSRAGQGVLGFVTLKNDLTARRVLKNIHHKEVAACTNVERSFMKMVGHSNLGAYCEKDKMDNYHLYAIIPTNDATFVSIRTSSSTTFGLAESAFQQFLSRR